MQTFLSEPGLHASAEVLDNKRLQKQYLEGWQILNAISLTPAGGGSRVDGKIPFASNHPVTNQYRGHEIFLYVYLNNVKDVLDNRGIKTDLLAEKIKTVMDAHFLHASAAGPVWYMDPVLRQKIQVTHRASLFKKDPEHYASYACESIMVDTYPDLWVCCPGKHANYYYPTHVEV